MATKVKRLLKGLRYISQIFDNDKEPEMQIGFPTDVKHVAHIGWDGPSACQPAWMNEFKKSSEPLSGVSNYDGEMSSNSSIKVVDSLVGSIMGMAKVSGAPSPLDSPTRRNSSKVKQSRWHNSSNGSVGSHACETSGSNKPRWYENPVFDSPTRDSSNRPRRFQNSNLGSESPVKDMPPNVTKTNSSKESKRISTKTVDLDSGSWHGLKDNKMRLNQQRSECDGISM